MQSLSADLDAHGQNDQAFLLPCLQNALNTQAALRNGPRLLGLLKIMMLGTARHEPIQCCCSICRPSVDLRTLMC